MQLKSKIVVIIPYFGTLPAWFEYFELSCSYNDSVDWLIFSDSLPTSSRYANVIYVQMLLPEFNKLASKKLELNISIKNAYKLCDLKPAYGEIFYDYIKNYSHWAYGDIDLIYGSFNNFIDQETLKKADVISMHSNFVPGHLCVLKNSAMVRQLFRQVANYEIVFKSQKYHGFDERIHAIKVLTGRHIINYSKRVKLLALLILEKIVKLKRLVVGYGETKVVNNKQSRYFDFSSLLFGMKSNKNLSIITLPDYKCDYWFRKEGINNWEIYWRNGKLYNENSGEQLLYFHFQLSKDKATFLVPEFQPDTTEFRINCNGIRC